MAGTSTHSIATVSAAGILGLGLLAPAVLAPAMAAPTAPAHVATAKATGYQHLSPAQLKKVVVNPAQDAPAGFGPVEVNLYGTDSGPSSRPVVCWSKGGAPRFLPAGEEGLLGYQMGQSTSLGVAVVQYPSAAEAKAAGQQLKTIVTHCPEVAKIKVEVGDPGRPTKQTGTLLPSAYGTKAVVTYTYNEGGPGLYVSGFQQVGNVLVHVTGASPHQKSPKMAKTVLQTLDTVTARYVQEAHA
ncbi:MAG: hypothetical protein R2737_15055 [Candidatus Nanopelagicales bacterium]